MIEGYGRLGCLYFGLIGGFFCGFGFCDGLWGFGIFIVGFYFGRFTCSGDWFCYLSLAFLFSVQLGELGVIFIFGV